MWIRVLVTAVVVLASMPVRALAQVPSGMPATPPAAAMVPDHPGQATEPAKPVITIGGYLEEYYQLQLQDASNRITNLRGFDNRSRTFTLSNVALDVKGETGPVTAHVVLQIG